MGDPRRDETQRLPESFQQIVWNVMASEKDATRRARKVLMALEANMRGRIEEVQAGTLPLAELLIDLDQFKANIHVIAKGIALGAA